MSNELKNKISDRAFPTGPQDDKGQQQCITKCVLVAEDDADDRFMFRRAWRKAHSPHRLIEVIDGEQVVHYLSAHPPYDDRGLFPLPDLVVLDLKMPKLNGFDVLAWIQGRPELRSMNVVVLSSSSIEADREFAARLGANVFLTKPTESSQLLAVVKRLHDCWLVHDASLVEGCSTKALSIRRSINLRRIVR